MSLCFYFSNVSRISRREIEREGGREGGEREYIKKSFRDYLGEERIFKFEKFKKVSKQNKY